MEALVNYNNNSNAYRVWDPSNAKVYNVGSPSFDESAKSGWWRLPGTDESDMDVEFPDLLTYTAPVPATPLQPAVVGMTRLQTSPTSPWILIPHLLSPSLHQQASPPTYQPALPSYLIHRRRQLLLVKAIGEIVECLLYAWQKSWWLPSTNLQQTSPKHSSKQ